MGSYDLILVETMISEWFSTSGAWYQSYNVYRMINMIQSFSLQQWCYFMWQNVSLCKSKPIDKKVMWLIISNGSTSCLVSKCSQ